MIINIGEEISMKLEDIQENWKVDSVIDKTEISDETIKIPKLHHKYYQILIHEKLVLRQFESEMKKLKLEKYEFYTQGHDEETKKKGWKLPAKGLILKADIPMYMEADEDIIQLSLKIGYQQEKIEFVDSIIRTLMNRGYQLKVVVDWEKFKNGI